jgi:hypothetical protein
MVMRAERAIKVLGGSAPGEIGDLLVEFVIPDAGTFGRDKHVSMDAATAAKVSYRRDGQLVGPSTMAVADALALVEQATKDTAAELERSADILRRQEVRGAEIRRLLAELACPICGGRWFDERPSHQGGELEATTYLRLLICRECRYVLQFATGRTR